MIKKEMTFAEALEKYPKIAEVFMKNGLFCCGCSMSQMESIEQGCQAHGVDTEKLIKELNKSIKHEGQNL